MKTTHRYIRLTYVTGGESVLAEMLDDEAPEVCRLVWQLLPLEHQILHAQYSGAEVFILLDNPQPAQRENLAQIPLPGELLYFYDPGGNVITGSRPISEICLIYGRGVTLRNHEGVPTHASLFARIPGDWKYDWAAFAEACQRSRSEKPDRLRIERVEPGS